LHQIYSHRNFVKSNFLPLAHDVYSYLDIRLHKVNTARRNKIRRVFVLTFDLIPTPPLTRRRIVFFSENILNILIPELYKYRMFFTQTELHLLRFTNSPSDVYNYLMMRATAWRYTQGIRALYIVHYILSSIFR